MSVEKLNSGRRGGGGAGRKGGDALSKYQDFSAGFWVSRKMWEEAVETAGEFAREELAGLTGKRPELVYVLRSMVDEWEKLKAEREAKEAAE